MNLAEYLLLYCTSKYMVPRAAVVTGPADAPRVAIRDLYSRNGPAPGLEIQGYLLGAVARRSR